MTREAKLYTTATCPYCGIAKKSLDDDGVKYQEFNIVEDKAARPVSRYRGMRLCEQICCKGEYKWL